jgi:hypothetical protein
VGVIWPACRQCSLFLSRAAYRVRQFVLALTSALVPLGEVDWADVQTILPAAAWPLFRAMPRSDQRHSLAVLRSVQRSPAQCDDVWAPSIQVSARLFRSLAQAALLHDCAKSMGGVRLWHRVAVVLIKALRLSRLAALSGTRSPVPGHWRYPFWAHANHPSVGADLAALSGCDPLAVWLIRHHQDSSPADFVGEVDAGLPDAGECRCLLAALQAADDRN